MSSSGLLTGEDKREAIYWLGPWLVGGCLDLFLQGVLMTQFVNYFSFYNDDKMVLRIIVMVLFLLTVLKSIHAFAIIWIQSIVYFGDLQGAILLNYTTWWQSGNPLMVALVGFYVQLYFCWRLWVISKKWYVAGPIALLFLFGFISIVVGTYFITVVNLAQIGVWFAAHLSSVFAGDIIMCFTTAYFLLKTKSDVLPQTVGLITALVRLTFQTAAPAALCAMFNLIFSQHNPGGSGIISTAFNMMLPKLYAVSMMWTLNARRTIRVTHSSHPGTSNEISGARSRARRTNINDVELGQIQVVTQTETTVDVRDIFDPTQKGDRDIKINPSPRSDDESERYSKT
ncbi:hypothetical protein C8F04DRAFT_126642 [Mycena alexandri]|uniref:DUF6534 domain-containing protein n=1 Tax=Mycena alexandri TaxID=1745969 RepID=A0AAD6SE25_9AGAR|nr:hypothetical protein C8F04DRAFT_126642 [Mycena alexandri]